MVVYSELVAAAGESVVHRTDQIIRAVINVQLRKEAAATYYISQYLCRPTLTLERTLQLHNDLAVWATDRHGETTHIATALTLETIRTLTSKEIGLLIASTHAISTRQKHIILILSLEASD